MQATSRFLNNASDKPKISNQKQGCLEIDSCNFRPSDIHAHTRTYTHHRKLTISHTLHVLPVILPKPKVDHSYTHIHAVYVDPACSGKRTSDVFFYLTNTPPPLKHVNPMWLVAYICQTLGVWRVLTCTCSHTTPHAVRTRNSDVAVCVHTQ